MLEIEYLTDKEGLQKAVVIPIKLWEKIMPKENASIEEISEEMENYCLGKAMDDAKKSSLLSRKEALHYLNTEE